MQYLKFVPYYFIWHYTLGVKDLLSVLHNFFWLNNHIFQYSFLLRDLFAPLNRLREGKFNIFSLDDILEFVIVNALMRFIGFGIRFIVLAIGFVFFLLTTLVSVLTFVFWLSAPFIIAALFYFGFTLIF